MYQLLYASSAKRKFSGADLQSLLGECRAFNGPAGITGMLLYEDGNFIQLLEGEETDVKRLFERIDRDSRHRGVLILDQGETRERQFGNWSMGFRQLEGGEDHDLDQAFALSSVALERHFPPELSVRVMTFMRNFYRIAGGL